MDRRTLTVKNCDEEVLESLRDIRRNERRQLAVIIEDCIEAYITLHYDEVEEGGRCPV
ncbi:hypothetical protein [Primorskyibacter sp. S87]|uniref:hypothetical protein n=1 Tax=Primorskyibacter sp. S87 TaxID=3415126 RepID=UPI003C7A6340